MSISNLRILIVDDDEGIRAFVKRILCGSPDSIFQCQSVGRFSDCLEICKNGETDYVILDLGLPDRLGFEGLRELHEDCPEIGVIILTAHNNQNDALRAIEQYGALAYILKPPLDIDEFYKAICDAIIRHKNQRKVNTKISKKSLMTLLGIISSVLAMLTALAVFGEKIAQFLNQQ